MRTVPSAGPLPTHVRDQWRPSDFQMRILLTSTATALPRIRHTANTLLRFRYRDARPQLLSNSQQSARLHQLRHVVALSAPDLQQPWHRNRRSYRPQLASPHLLRHPVTESSKNRADFRFLYRLGDPLSSSLQVVPRRRALLEGPRCWSEALSRGLPRREDQVIQHVGEKTSASSRHRSPAELRRNTCNFLRRNGRKSIPCPGHRQRNRQHHVVNDANQRDRHAHHASLHSRSRAHRLLPACRGYTHNPPMPPNRAGPQHLVGKIFQEHAPRYSRTRPPKPVSPAESGPPPNDR